MDGRAPREEPKCIVTGPRARARLDAAARWLEERGQSTELVIVGATTEAAHDLACAVAHARGASFGWQRFTLRRLAGTLAFPLLAAQGKTPVGALSLEAVCTRIVQKLGAADALGRFAAIRDRPGLPRAIARTLHEVRLAGHGADTTRDVDLARLLAAYREELALAKLADAAEVLLLATAAAATTESVLLGKPVLFLDPRIATALERDFVRAVADQSPDVLVTVPAGDDRSLRAAEAALGVSARILERASARPTSLESLQRGLFESRTEPRGEGDDVELFSAPGESRECVEIARRVLREAEQGVRFDEIAILLRSPQKYAAHLEEALGRAKIPAYFARGTVRPDPAGRAFLALLACAAEGLSARRFAEYLSLGEVPDADPAGAPPSPLPSGQRWAPPDEDLVAIASPAATDEPSPRPFEPSAPVAEGTLRAPRRWERLLVDAAVIGGHDRWARRIDGLSGELALDLRAFEDDDPRAARTKEDIRALAALRSYALPLIEDLEELRGESGRAARTWGEWLERLSAIATRSIRDPDRVLAVLAELAPMAKVGPVGLTEVRLVLERRLAELVVPPRARRQGHVYIASIEEARGLAFDVVFVPGLAEKLFPQKVTEDPILPDRGRAGAAEEPLGLVTNRERAADERLALRLAVGAAKTRVVLSYPRLDVEEARPRTPSFYALEVLRVSEGKLPGFEELARRADVGAAARVGWPAPSSPADAIDEAEHDLALLDRIFVLPEKETQGMARYLLSANEHLARALRFRGRRWLKKWVSEDGLVDPAPAARAALAAHGFGARSYSPTALQNFAACPYRFLLSAVHKLAPREEPLPIEELDPLQRGSLIHEVLFELSGTLRDRGLLPVTNARLDEARALLEEIVDRTGKRYADDLAPAITRVWDDGIAGIKADVREWLRRSTLDHEWVPAHFELSFGLTERRDQDPNSVAEPIPLACGIKLRGSIDLVERSTRGAIRATDYKTGKKRADEDTVIGGGETLQPALYALVLEKRFPDVHVESGRLYYCTKTGNYEAFEIPLNDAAREGIAVVAKTIGDALSEGFLPAAPAPKACVYCDFRPVCGPHEELRTSIKRQERLAPLHALRKRP